jgi:hypothetical protein
MKWAERPQVSSSAIWGNQLCHCGPPRRAGLDSEVNLARYSAHSMAKCVHDSTLQVIKHSDLRLPMAVWSDAGVALVREKAQQKAYFVRSTDGEKSEWLGWRCWLAGMMSP